MEITAVSGDALIVERGQSPNGCPQKNSKRRTPLPGKWLALTPTAIHNANPFVVVNAVQSDKTDERFFFTGVPLKLGRIQIATITPIPTGTTARTEADIELGASRYRFVEWGGGASEFALIPLGPSGKKKSLDVLGSSSQSIPQDAYLVSAEVRDYGFGSLEVVRAGDFNGDGIVDLLLGYQTKEAEGLVLWLSDPVSKKHMEPLVSPTMYTDC